MSTEILAGASGAEYQYGDTGDVYEVTLFIKEEPSLIPANRVGTVPYSYYVV